ncbi:MAG TPA: hypothetical protein VD931_23520 [Baekduia sp.]|nr:hypothetical protein [Baekduia sp.]
MPIRITSAAALAATLVAAPAALADKRIEAASPNRFTTPAVTMDQGERLTFLNRDFVMHDVTAVLTGPDRKPLFATPLLGRDQEAFVEGSQYLTTGAYDFLCSVHPEMKGQLTVTSAGTPQQRPGTGAPGADTTAPAVRAAVATGTLRKARRDGALAVRVTLEEAARVTAVASAGGRTLGRRTVRAAAGTTAVRIRLDAADLRRLRGRAVVVRVTAADAAGNRATARASRRLRG